MACESTTRIVTARCADLWDGVDIDWSNLAGELEAHWADATEEPYIDPEFRALVVAEIERAAKAAIRDLARQDAEELDEPTEPAAAQIARWKARARETGDRDLLRALAIRRRTGGQGLNQVAPRGPRRPGGRGAPRAAERPHTALRSARRT